MSLTPSTGQIRDTKLGSTTHGQQGPNSGARDPHRAYSAHRPPQALPLHADRARHCHWLSPQHGDLGVWVARVADGKGGNWTRTVGLADDFEDADGTNALTFWPATDKILKLVRGSDDAARRPTTIAEVIDQYEKDLAARGRAVSNARRIRKHLPPALAAKIVALLAERDFSTWRDDLLDGGMPSATFVRLAKASKSALALCNMRCGMAHRCQAPLVRVDQRVTIPLASLVVLPALPSLPKNPAT